MYSFVLEVFPLSLFKSVDGWLVCVYVCVWFTKRIMSNSGGHFKRLVDLRATRTDRTHANCSRVTWQLMVVFYLQNSNTDKCFLPLHLSFVWIFLSWISISCPLRHGDLKLDCVHLVYNVFVGNIFLIFTFFHIEITSSLTHCQYIDICFEVIVFLLCILKKI